MAINNEKDNGAFDGAFEVMLDAASDKAAEDLGENIQKPDEIEFSAEHEKRMSGLFARERRKLRAKRVIKYSRHCACVVLVLILAAGIGIYNVEAWRIKILNFFLDDGGVASKVVIETEESADGGSVSSAGSNANIAVSYVPDGFDIAADECKEDFLVFRNIENPDIYFDVSVDPIGGNITIDTEDMTQEHITINGYDAVYLEKERYQSVLCYDDDWVYFITGNIGKELIKVAEEVKKF